LLLKSLFSLRLFKFERNQLGRITRW